MVISVEGEGFNHFSNAEEKNNHGRLRPLTNGNGTDYCNCSKNMTRSAFFAPWVPWSA
ncbi:hypothetical protein WCLP8_1660001 [uncultured Gammaproteobacteria bacterium]